jgi:hypothetical protein
MNHYKLKRYLIKLGSIETIYKKLKYDTSRIPANCDRILYKSKKINPIKYGVYYDNDLIRLSDHLLVYGEFKYNSYNCIIFTWNMANINNYNKIGIAKLLVDFKLLEDKYNMIIFCLQESSGDLFIKILIESFLSTKYKVSINTSYSLLGNFDVRLIIFHKKCASLSGLKLNLEPNILKSFFNNKTCVSLTIDGLTIISCHFPLDTTKKDFGNDMRINAMRKIKEQFKDLKNILLAGDLNFRIVDDFDQLTKYLNNQKRFKFSEFTPALTEYTYKLETCK